jgi:hypothetical protein
MNIFNLIFKHKTMSEDNEPQTEETKVDEVFRDKPENEEDKSEELPENAEGGLKEETELKPETEEEAEIQKEAKTVEDEEIVETKEADEGDVMKVDAEPLYQKKVYIVDLNNLGLKIEGEGSLIVDVMSIDKETQKATVKNGDLTMEVPKEFLF